MLYQLGNCHFRLEQFQQAAARYKQLAECWGEGEPASVKEEERLARTYNNLGCCYSKLGLEKLSMGAFGQALQLYGRRSADCSSLLYNIANLYQKCAMHGVAEKYYSEAVAELRRRQPNEHARAYHALYKLGQAQVEQEHYGDAL